LKPEGPVGLKKREIVMQAAVDYLREKGSDNGEEAEPMADMAQQSSQIVNDDET